MILKKLIKEKEIKDVLGNEQNEFQKMNFEYYLVEQEVDLNQKVYGVEIIKKKVFSDEIFVESEIFIDISPIRDYVEKTVEIFADNLVTPNTLYDVLVDRLGCELI